MFSYPNQEMLLPKPNNKSVLIRCCCVIDGMLVALNLMSHKDPKFKVSGFTMLFTPLLMRP